MRSSVVGLLVFITGAARSDEPRHGIALDAKTYPQATPKETLASVIKAVENKRIDYLVAQLADPEFIDERVKQRYGGRFAEQVEDTAGQLNPTTLKLFARFLKDGDWTIEVDRASVRLKDMKERTVFFRRVGARWYLEHRWKP